MTPEERKAIAMRQEKNKRCWETPIEWSSWPKCCSYHEGFDAALALLVDFGIHPHDCTPVYAIEATP